MSLRRLQISAVRCLEHVDLALHPGRNYFFGPNGAGKTSLLESVYLLGRGRSFRTRDTRRLIKHGERRLAVFGEALSRGHARRLGIGFEAGKLEKRLDGRPAESMAALAEVLPVYVVDPSSHALVEGGPSERRRFLDWGVFHVEPNYLAAWRRYRRLLGQRNAALKAGASAAELGAWSANLAAEGEAVDRLRREYVERLEPLVGEHGRALLGTPLQIDYRRGWPDDLDLAATLAERTDRDRLTGNTEAGPHRADLKIRVASGEVRDEASRGQQKLAAAALILAQVAAHAGAGGEGAVLLVDDPAAELDRVSLGRLVGLLERTPAQLLLTGLPGSALEPSGDGSVFHVEQGAVHAVL